MGLLHIQRSTILYRSYERTAARRENAHNERHQRAKESSGRNIRYVARNEMRIDVGDGYYDPAKEKVFDYNGEFKRGLEPEEVFCDIYREIERLDNDKVQI